MTFQSPDGYTDQLFPSVEMTRRDPCAFARANPIALIHYFVFFALQCLKIFAACANFPVARGYPKRGFARVKTPRTLSPEV